MYKGVIFDLDGTLLDTLADLAASVNAALLACDLPPRTVGEVRAFVGNGIPNLIARAVPVGTDPATEARVLAAFGTHYAAHMADTTAPYPDIPDILAALAARGIKTAVVSNKDDYATAELVRRHFHGMIDIAVGAKAGVPKKPAPDAVFAAISKLGIAPTEAVYIGDSEVDVMTAKNAATDCIAVSWGFRYIQTLRDAGATRICDTPASLRAALGIAPTAAGVALPFIFRRFVL